VSNEEPLHFELDRLVSYDDASLIAELQRVAALVAEPTMTRAAFRRHSRAGINTILRRFGTWQEALERAGLGERYSGQRVSENMRNQSTRSMTADDLLAELRRVAKRIGSRTLTREQFRSHSNMSGAVPTHRFGSWTEALRRAGLEPVPHGRRWTADDYFENLLAVWTQRGRPPTYAEMNLPPSKISNGSYAKRFGTWGRAKVAFVEKVNADLGSEAGPTMAPLASSAVERPPAPKPEDCRSIRLGLRYKVLSRDRFRCVICGRSPATDLTVELHVDHIVPVAAGGKTHEGNLRSLCADCNLGKGAKIEVREAPS
jgi:hypothetical protein